jgi:ESCRT-I complex subunit VPS28
MGDTAPELDAFCREYSLECRAAEQRFKVGIPATVVHGEVGGAGGGGFGGGGAGGAGGGGSDRRMEVSVFHAVQNFITLMDSLKLGQRAVDELHPPLVELVDSISRVPSLPQDHESRQKTMSWLTTLHQMKAHQELNDEQTRQMAFDLDSAYNAFHKFVKGH